MASDLQQAWLDRYLVCWNATQAARDVGYKWPNKKGPELKLLFADEIKKRIEEKTMAADELLIRVAQHARGNLAEYLDANGEPDIERLKADGLGHLLKKYKKVVKRTITKDGREYETEYYEAELYPADSAHDRLMRYHGLYKDKVEHTWRDKLPPEKASTADEFFRKVSEGLAAQLKEDGNSRT